MKFLLLLCILSSCTFSINCTHTQGNAKGVGDEEERQDVQTDLNASFT